MFQCFIILWQRLCLFFYHDISFIVQVKLDHDDDDGDSEFEISDEEDEEEEVKYPLSPGSPSYLYFWELSEFFLCWLKFASVLV